MSKALKGKELIRSIEPQGQQNDECQARPVADAINKADSATVGRDRSSSLITWHPLKAGAQAW